MLVLHRAKLLASNQSVLALGAAPSGVRAAAPHSAPARMPGVYAQRLCTMQSQPSIHSLSRGEGVFGKDAEIRTHRALHEAKPSECPKGDRDNKSEVYFNNRLFLQAELCLKQTQFSCQILLSPYTFVNNP